MKSLTLFAVLVALAGGTALAQQDMGRSSVSGAGYTTGVVELIDANSMTLREDSSRVVTLLIVPATVGADNRLAGNRVRVTFHLNANNQAIADEIQGAKSDVEPQAAATAPVPEYKATPTPAPTVAKEKVYVQEPVSTPEPSAVSTPMMEPTLPHTASPLAAIGLLGLLSLAGALAIRFTR